MSVHACIVDISERLLPYMKISSLQHLQKYWRTVQLAHKDAIITRVDDGQKSTDEILQYVLEKSGTSSVGKASLVLVIYSAYIFITAYDLRQMLQKASEGYCVRLLSSRGEIAALCNNSCAQNDCIDIILPEFRSLCLQCTADILVGESIFQDWTKYYFNNGYLEYWEKRLQPDAQQRDNVPADDVFQRLFTLASQSVNTDSKRLLDAGCGDGRLFHVYEQASYEAIGVDISRDMVLAALQKRSVSVQSGTLENTGQPANAFDMVVAWGVFDSTDQSSALHHLLGRLKQGGVFLCSGKNYHYDPEDLQALRAEYNAALKLFPNGFSDFSALLAAVRAYGGKVRQAFYAPLRGDLGNGTYVSVQPDVFYEWVLIIEKVDETPLLPEVRVLSSPTSMHFAKAQELFGHYSA